MNTFERLVIFIKRLFIKNKVMIQGDAGEILILTPEQR